MKPSREIERIYDKEYFLTLLEGSKEFFEHNASGRLKKSFELGDVKSGMNVLDYGCGRGEIALMSALKGANSIGLDPSKYAIEIAKNNVKGIPTKFLTYAVFKFKKSLPFENNYFDVIFFVDVVEHISQEEFHSLLQEFHRILKKNGRLVVHTAPNKNYLDIGYKYYTKPLLMVLSAFKNFRSLKTPVFDDRNKTHINEQTPQSLKEDLIKYGFRTRVLTRDLPPNNYREMLYRFVFRPSYLLPTFFSLNIWAVGVKK